MVLVPKQLRDNRLRFYRAGPSTSKKWAKVAIDKKWNSENNYKWNDPTIIHHTENYGVCCGYGGLVVLDFDDKEFYEEMAPMLTPTFTVLTANKRLPHYYYFVEGMSKPLKKVPIDNVKGERVCDIQGLGSGVIGPGSIYDRKYYEVLHDREIATIHIDDIKFWFVLNEDDVRRKKLVKQEYHTDLVERAMAFMVLERCGVTVYTDINMQCPFHAMSGTGNLSVLPSGLIYCFHCLRSLWPKQFLKEWLELTWKQTYNMIKDMFMQYNKQRVEHGLEEVKHAWYQK